MGTVAETHFERKYALGRELGRGGMGVVHEGLHRSLERPVAIKVLRREGSATPNAFMRFVAEGRAIARIRHPHIVEVFDLEIEEDVAYLVMERLTGMTLARWLLDRGRLSVGQAVDLFLPLASALFAAHEAGIVHRDIKPSNIFLRDGRLSSPCLLDFGVSKYVRDSEAVETDTQTGALLGSYPYFSPEQTRGASAVTERSDQYSLAVVLYECVTGVRPFDGGAYEVMHAIATREVPPPSSLCGHLPREIDDAVLRATRRDPLQRFPTVHALGSALIGLARPSTWHRWSEEFLGAEDQRSDVGTARTIASLTPRQPQVSGYRRSGVLWAGLALAVLVGGAGAAWSASQPVERPGTHTLAAATLESAVAPTTARSDPPLAATQSSASAPSTMANPVSGTDAPTPTVVRRSVAKASPGASAARGSNGVPILE